MQITLRISFVQRVRFELLTGGGRGLTEEFCHSVGSCFTSGDSRSNNGPSPDEGDKRLSTAGGCGDKRVLAMSVMGSEGTPVESEVVMSSSSSARLNNSQAHI